MNFGRWHLALGRRLLPGCLWRGDGSRAEVALSFDDGPDPLHTPALLDVLDRLGVAATFFWLGGRLAGAPEVVARVAGSPHQIGLHGALHRPFLGRRAAAIRDELDRLRDDLAARTGRPAESLRHVRPPFGLIGPLQARRLESWGYRVVLCDVLPADWSAPPGAVVRRVLAGAGRGSLVALHDGEPHAGPSVAQAVSEIVPRLRERGLRFVTVDRLG